MERINFTQFCERIPKADLHYHLLGGVRLQTMLDLAVKYQVPLSLEDAQSYYRAFAAKNKAMKGGIAALQFLYSLMREPSDYQRVIWEVAEDAHQCGVRYIETFWNPTDTSFSYQQITDALVESITGIEQQMGLIIRLIPSINREKTPEQAIEMVEAVIANPHPFVLGIGIDYQEKNAPVEQFWKAYQLAGKAGLKLTAHCSEFGLHWRNVETGVELLNLDRIDHGYTIIENPSLCRRYAEKSIPFTVVPSNTFYLRLWPDSEQWRTLHPIRQMAKRGLMIIPCSDDWHIHNTTTAKCFQTMSEAFGFDLLSLKQLMLNGLEASWLPKEIKIRWAAQWQARFDQLCQQLDGFPAIEPTHVIKYRR